MTPRIRQQTKRALHIKLGSQSVGLQSLSQVDLKDECRSASPESAGLQTGGEEQDGLLNMLERHRQRGAGPPG